MFFFCIYLPHLKGWFLKVSAVKSVHGLKKKEEGEKKGWGPLTSMTLSKVFQFQW